MAGKHSTPHHSHFIQRAVPKSRRGIFSAKAKRAGMSTHAYAEKEKNSSNPRLRHEAQLALVLERLGRKGRRKRK
jgi:hypothetical protein